MLSSILKKLTEQGTPARMFTKKHFIAFSICIALVSIILYVTRNLKWEKVKKISKITTIIITILEITKIIYAFSIGHTWLDAWFPLSFCSLFIYSLWFANFTKGKLQKLGTAFIEVGALTGGFFFLVFPTTSLMNYPITHFLCLYSLFFHSAMMIMSLLYLRKCPVFYSKDIQKNYFQIFTITATFYILFNILFKTNLMILRQPYNIPVELIQLIYQKIPILYTIIALLIYIIVPTIITKTTNNIITKQKTISS